jgi:hypothetical protein
MKKQTKRIITERMTELLASRNPFVATEAARLILACEGIFPVDGLTAQQGANSKASAQLAIARNHVATQFQHKRDQKRVQNRRYYVRKKLKGHSQEDIEQELAKLEANPQAQLQPQGKPSEFLDSKDPDLIDFNKYPITFEEEDDFKDNAKRGQDIEDYIREKRIRDATVNKLFNYINGRND